MPSPIPQPLGDDEVDGMLAELGWTPRQLMEALGLSRYTARQWRCNTGIPRYAREYLRVCVELRQLKLTRDAEDRAKLKERVG